MSPGSRLPQRGEPVRVRGERWRVLSVASHEGCALVECAGVEAGNAGVAARFIVPFDQVDPIGALHMPRLVRPAVWRRAAAAALAGAVPAWWSLRAAAAARIALLPYQLEPALAMCRGLACRMLLADDVGLGKTIQAGLIVAELLARDRDARVLIVTPAGLREQWQDELRERFSVTAAVVDAAALARAAAELPPAMNPWSVQRVAIVSIDFLKRPDVIRSLEPLAWDLVAFDEAHALCRRSDRAIAAELVAARARRVLLVTATPHDGDEAGFERLQQLGKLGADDPLLTFRRSGAAAGISRRRVERRLGVLPTPEEARVHRALDVYAARVAREAVGASGTAGRLAALVLQRRAASSVASLARSLERRMALLSEAVQPTTTQMPLPWADGSLPEDEEPSGELAAPGFADRAAEQRWLTRLLALARRVTGEIKLRQLRRLLQRTGEPALVFTEYRDTLRHVLSALDVDCAVLHGGLAPAERLREVKRFTHGTARVLLATDAASEGINLHQRCRLVVNLDVPWTPLRLEQRVGRVDRLGQSRPVHAITFVARGTADVRVAAALAGRAARAERDAPFGDGAAAGLRELAAAEAERLELVRRLMDHRRTGDGTGRPVTTVFRRRTSRPSVLALRLCFVDADGAIVWDTVEGLLVTRSNPGPSHDAVRGWLDTTMQQHAIALAAAAAEAHGRRLATLRADLRAAAALLMAREHAMLDRLARDQARLAARLLQPGLFDARALRDRDAQRRVAAEAVARATARVRSLERTADVHAGDRWLVFAAAWLE